MKQIESKEHSTSRTQYSYWVRQLGQKEKNVRFYVLVLMYVKSLPRTGGVQYTLTKLVKLDLGEKNKENALIFQMKSERVTSEKKGTHKELDF